MKDAIIYYKFKGYFMFRFLTVILLFVLFVGAGEFEVKNVDDFPILKSKNDNAKKINIYLQNLILEKQVKKRNIEKNRIYGKDENWIRRTDGYNIYANNAQIFSLSVNMTHSNGMTYPEYFLFNSQNGEKILLEELLSDKGYEMIDEKYTKYQTLIYTDIEKWFGNKVRGDENLEEKLLECREMINSEGVGGFYIQKDEIIFPMNSHSCEFQDEKTDEYKKDRYTMKLSEIKKYLSNFGKKILLDKKADVSNYYFGDLGTFLKVEIENGEKATIILDKNLETGSYFYDKIGVRIDFELVKFEGDNVRIVAEDNSIIEIKLVDNGIKGTWILGKKKYLIKAKNWR